MTGTTAARPLVLIDVDGVLNARPGPGGLTRLLAQGWQVTQVANFSGTWPVVYNPRHGELLTGLAAAAGAQLAWGTAWEHDANELIAPLVGLPSLPVAPVRGRPTKAHGAVPWTTGRPFVWFDDDYDVAAAAAELADWPHKVILVNRAAGLTRAHIAQARDWLLAQTR